MKKADRDYPETDLAMKTWKCPDGHSSQTSVAHPRCPVCGKLMVRTDK